MSSLEKTATKLPSLPFISQKSQWLTFISRHKGAVTIGFDIHVPSLSSSQEVVKVLDDIKIHRPGRKTKVV